MKIQVTINGVDYTPYTILPIKWNELLDERLDERRLSLRNTNIKLFPIGATVVVSIDSASVRFIVGADESTERPAGSGLYDHELSIIEPVKETEGVVVGTVTFTNSLGRTYTANQVKVEPVKE